MSDINSASINSDDLGQLRANAGRACDLLRVMANSDRLLLLCQLTQGEYSVSELAERTGIEQPTLSQQLAVLRKYDLVSTTRRGKQIFYRLSSPAGIAVLQVLHQQFCSADRGEANEH